MAPLRNTLLVGFSLIAVVIAALLGLQQTPLIDDTTYCYDHVSTLAESKPVAKCFSVGSDGTFTRIYASQDDAPDAHVKISGSVIPGLWDGHGHIQGLGELISTVDLFGSTSMEDALQRVSSYFEKHATSGTREDWLRGTGWDQAAFGRMPTANDFDKIPGLKDKYIMLSRVDVHCVWVSHAVLKLLPDIPEKVPGGEIITDPGRGVFCDNAIDLVSKHWPKPSEEKLASWIKSAMKEMNKVGLVGAHEAGVIPPVLQLYNRLADTEDWTVRVYAMLECEKRNTFCPEIGGKFTGARQDGKLAVQSVKLFADGALGSWGSAMIEPYSDRPSSSGSLLINGTDLKLITQRWAQEGYQVNIHAIGDLANRYAVDAFLASYPLICPGMSAKECQATRRFRIEHSQIIHPDDQARIHKFGIIPSIQPTHATSDMAYAEARLGPERTSKEAYRMKSFIALNPILGSDFPVEPANPFHGMYAAITRRNPKTGKGKDGSTDGWHSEEALNLTEAVLGFTKNPAYGAFLEEKAGVIQPGAFADWVVLESPLEKLAADDLLTLKVQQTWMAGKLVYAKSNKQ
ncbi:amidohydrolase [Microthyrium microscopicum]|uniref:Amidohydrolase n=1 Tax=Microthyrium microscopicum TaxID=703497 RepID=A0A6A6TVB7_9PEZI|nr:amidohydrolase [Microthyrium microscopicum]